MGEVSPNPSAERMFTSKKPIDAICSYFGYCFTASIFLVRTSGVVQKPSDDQT